jgi:hypothetical protein
MLLTPLAVADTLSAVASSSRSIPTEFIALIGVIVGGLISLIGSLLAQKRQPRIQLQQDFFSRRLDVYLKTIELLWRGQNYTRTGGAPESVTPHPNAYDSYQSLVDWTNSLSEYSSSHRLLIDELTLAKLEALNAKTMSDLAEISSTKASTEATLDKRTQKLDRESLDEIMRLCDAIDDTARSYLKSTYKIDV